MEKIDYDTPQCQPNRRNAEKKDSFLTRLVFCTGLAKDKKQANIVLLVLAGAFFFLTIGIFLSDNVKTKNSDSTSIPLDIPYQDHYKYIE